MKGNECESELVFVRVTCVRFRLVVHLPPFSVKGLSLLSSSGNRGRRESILPPFQPSPPPTSDVARFLINFHKVVFFAVKKGDKSNYRPLSQCPPLSRNRKGGGKQNNKSERHSQLRRIHTVLKHRNAA